MASFQVCSNDTILTNQKAMVQSAQVWPAFGPAAKQLSQEQVVLFCGKIFVRGIVLFLVPVEKFAL